MGAYLFAGQFISANNDNGTEHIRWLWHNSLINIHPLPACRGTHHPQFPCVIHYIILSVRSVNFSLLRTMNRRETVVFLGRRSLSICLVVGISSQGDCVWMFRKTDLHDSLIHWLPLCVCVRDTFERQGRVGDGSGGRWTRREGRKEQGTIPLNWKAKVLSFSTVTFSQPLFQVWLANTASTRGIYSNCLGRKNNFGIKLGRPSVGEEGEKEPSTNQLLDWCGTQGDYLLMRRK